MKNVDKIRHDVVEQSLIMSNDDHRPVLTTQGVDPVGDDAQGTDIQTRVSLVEYRQFRIQNRHLKNFVAFLFPAGKTFVERTVDEVLLHLNQFYLLFDKRKELHGIQLFESAMLSHRIDGSLEEIGRADARNFDGILKR